MSKQKFYVVWRGRKPGIYNTWEECNEQVYKVKNSSHKSFDNLVEAQEAFASGNDEKPLAKSKEVVFPPLW